MTELENAIVSRFLGEEFKKIEATITEVLQCVTLDKFLRVKDQLPSNIIDDIFASCNKKDSSSAMFSDRESKNIYNRLRTVSSSIDFI